MKSKLIFLFLFTLLVQTSNAQVFGVKGGINLANMTFSSSGIDFSPKSILGIHIGPVMEMELQVNLYFNSGLLYSIKGFKIKVEYGGESMESTEKINYLEIPLNVAYKFSASGIGNVFIQAGPYLGYAMSGKDKTDGETTDIEFGDGGMKRFDFGLGVGLGTELGAIVPSISYQLGLANLSDDSDATVKNKVFQISVAYMFGK